MSAEAWLRYRASGYLETAGVQAMVPNANVSAVGERPAYWATFLYQRLHADVLQHALIDARFNTRTPGPIRLIDVGCGAGTAGVAVAELLTCWQSQDPIFYFGFDHNPTMRHLATSMLSHPGVLPPGSAVSVMPTLNSAVAAALRGSPGHALTLVTLSYFFRQEDVTSRHAEDVGRSLTPLINPVAPVRILVTDATGRSSDDRYPQFRASLRRFHVTDVLSFHPIQYELRFPYLYDGEGSYRCRTPKDPTAVCHFLKIRP